MLPVRVDRHHDRRVRYEAGTSVCRSEQYLSPDALHHGSRPRIRRSCTKPPLSGLLFLPGKRKANDDRSIRPSRSRPRLQDSTAWREACSMVLGSCSALRLQVVCFEEASGMHVPLSKRKKPRWFPHPPSFCVNAIFDQHKSEPQKRHHGGGCFRNPGTVSSGQALLIEIVSAFAFL